MEMFWGWSWISALTSSENRPGLEGQMLGECNFVLYSKPCLTWYLVSFRTRFFLQWAAEHCDISHHLIDCSLSKWVHLQLLPSAQIFQVHRVYNKYLCFMETSWSFARDFNEVRISLLKFLGFFNMLKQFNFFFSGKDLSLKEVSENFAVSFFTQTCQRRFGRNPTLKHTPFSSSLSFQ